METSDRDIIARVLAGDRESFHDLVRRHSEPVFGTLRGLLGNVEDARDVFQETWLRAFQRLAVLREPDRFRAWLLSIALNLVRQHHRRGWVRMETRNEVERTEDRSEDVHTALSRRELVQELRKRMEGLPSRQRQVLDLRLNHELSHAEIAVMLGISEENSRANYYQALRKLRSVLDEIGGASA